MKKIFSKEVFDQLNSSEKMILHYMYNSGQKMTTKKATELTQKGTTFCRKMLKNLEEKKILKWHGTSTSDRTQCYTLNL